MAAILLIAALVGAVWLPIVLMRGGLLVGLLAAVFSSIVLGFALYRQPLGPVELTLDRALAGLMVAQYVAWRLLRPQIRPPAAVDYFLLAFTAWLTIETILFPPTSGPAIGKLLCYYLIPPTVYFVARQGVRSEAGATAIFVFFALLGTYLAATAVAENRQWWSLVVPSYIGSSQYPEFLGRARGPLLNPAGNGILLITACASVVALWNRSWTLVRPLLAGTIVLMLGAAFLTLTRSVWMGAAVSVAFLIALVLPRRASFGFAAIALAALLPVAFVDLDTLLALKRDRGMDAAASADSVRLRPILAYIAYSMFLDHPIAGVGFGGYDDAAIDYTNDRTVDLPVQKGAGYVQHNVLLGLLTETGLIGLGLFLIVITIWIRDAWRLWRDRAMPPQQRRLGLLFCVLMINYLVNGMFQDVAIIQSLHVVLFFLAGTVQGVVVGARQGAVAVTSPPARSAMALPAGA